MTGWIFAIADVVGSWVFFAIVIVLLRQTRDMLRQSNTDQRFYFNALLREEVERETETVHRIARDASADPRRV